MNIKELNKKFWKLKQLDRIEYKLNEKEIKEKYKVSWTITTYVVTINLFIFFLAYGIVYFYGNGLFSFKELGVKIFESGLIYILIGLSLDIILNILFVFFEGKEIKKLKRRFKL